jgi:TPR repeat protein
MANTIYDAEGMVDAFAHEEYEFVLKMAMPHAVAGNSDAQGMVALLYQCGLGVERDALEAERWYLKATAQNNPMAWHNLGSLYALKLPELEQRWQDRRKCWERAKELGFNCGDPYPPPE